MSRSEKLNEKLRIEIASLRQELVDLKHEKAELELLLRINTEHGDIIEDYLLNKVDSTEKTLRRYRDELESLVAERTLKLIKVNEKLADVNLRLRETLKRESIQDSLTNLYSRYYMEKSLERELSRCKRHEFPLTVIKADIDHFKTLNDTYGHIAGDLDLQRLGQYLESNIRQEDIACRYGREEFALILPQASPENIRQRAEQMRVEVKEHLKTTYQNTILGITISMGIAGFPEHGTNSGEILGAADFALYRAKGKGCDRIEVAIAS